MTELRKLASRFRCIQTIGYCLSLFVLNAPACAEVLSFSAEELKAQIHTRTQYDMKGLGTWNGAPVTDANHPSDYENQLAATFSFFVKPESDQVLFVQVSHVQDTAYGFILGAPFASVALTGFSFSFGAGHGSLQPTDAAFSNAYANPGEVLLGSGVHEPLTETPGWSFLPADDEFNLRADSVTSAFTHFPNVFGTTRIYGGGLFAFDFGPHAHLNGEGIFSHLNGYAVHGADEYIAPGTLWLPTHGGGGSHEPPSPPAVPEPSTYLLVSIGLALVVRRIGGRHRGTAG